MKKIHAGTYKVFSPSVDDPEEGEVYVYAGYEPTSRHPFGYCLRTVVSGIRDGQGNHGYTLQRLRVRGAGVVEFENRQAPDPSEQSVAA
jgi:hypothetical protein